MKLKIDNIGTVWKKKTQTAFEIASLINFRPSFQ